MDTYEKKYKEAQKWIESIYPNLSHEQQMEAEAFFPELKESEDEKTRKRIIALVNAHGQGMYKDDMLAWLENIPYTIDHEKREGFHLGYKAGLEKQANHANFCNKIQVGDKVTRNRDGVLVNLSQLNRVAKKDEKQGEQKPAEWNEDSNSIISDLLDYFDEDKCLKHEVNDIVEWLKNIKPQQKEWGENEIKMLDNLITYLDSRKDLLEEIKSTYISWLKSLKERIGGKL